MRRRSPREQVVAPGLDLQPDGSESRCNPSLVGALPPSPLLSL